MTTASEHDGGEAEDQRRVHQRRFDLAPQGVGLLDLIGDPVQRALQLARLLSGADHREEELVEDLRVALHRLLQRAAGLDIGPHSGDRVADPFVLALLFERVQGAQHRHPRGDEGGELAREDGQLAHVDALPASPDVLDLEGLVLFGDVENDQAALAQLLGDLGLGVGLDFAGRRTAGHVHRPEGECGRSRHRLGPLGVSGRWAGGGQR